MAKHIAVEIGISTRRRHPREDCRSIETLLDKPHWEGKMLVGLFNGFIPTPDANRQRHYERMELWLRNGMLQGEANAEAADDEPAHYSLSSYVEVKRAAQ